MGKHDRSFVSIHEIHRHGLEEKEGLYSKEASEASDVDPRVEIIGTLMRVLLPSTKLPAKKRFEAGYRRLVVLVWMLTPDSLPAQSIEELAVLLECSKWNVYDIRTDLRRQLGLDGAGPSEG